jgi:hypothetical protein
MPRGRSGFDGPLGSPADARTGVQARPCGAPQELPQVPALEAPESNEPSSRAGLGPPTGCCRRGPAAPSGRGWSRRSRDRAACLPDRSFRLRARIPGRAQAAVATARSVATGAASRRRSQAHPRRPSRSAWARSASAPAGSASARAASAASAWAWATVSDEPAGATGQMESRGSRAEEPRRSGLPGQPGGRRARADSSGDAAHGRRAGAARQRPGPPRPAAARRQAASQRSQGGPLGLARRPSARDTQRQPRQPRLPESEEPSPQ